MAWGQRDQLADVIFFFISRDMAKCVELNDELHVAWGQRDLLEDGIFFFISRDMAKFVIGASRTK